ncbi:MAG TPA: hypothetical protein VGJ02_09070 [Pyrinomonadaceae bacterium]|jgi:hypothetical protein
MFRLCFCAGLVVFAFVFTAAAQEIPFKIEKGYLLIDGKAKGDLPFEAAVSTGSPYSYYNEASMKKLRLTESSSSDIPGTVFTKDNAMTLVYATLAVADQKPTEIRTLARREAFDAISKALGRKIDFILGADYFDGLIIQFDFKTHVVRILDKPAFEYKPGTFASQDGGVRFVSRMTGNTQSMFGNMLTLPVSDDVTLNGSRSPSLLNTGVVMPVIARPSAAKDVAKGSSGQTTVKVALGSYEMAGVPIRLDDVKDEYDRSYSSILGLGLMQNFTITLDWKNKWIVLEK